MIVETGDGSSTIFSKNFDAHYHSIHGARQESEHVFIDAGLRHYLDNHNDPISILEIGLGTGLNCFLTALYANNKPCDIFYHGVEAYPIEEGLVKNLSYPANGEQNALLEKIHQCAWREEVKLHEHFTLLKSLTKFEEIELESRYNIIYFDAFAPACQPHLWESAFLQRMYDCLLPSGLLVTYCAKGSFKRALKEVGFTVEGIPGPPRKREMTRATK